MPSRTTHNHVTAHGPAIRALRKRTGWSIAMLAQRVREQSGLTLHTDSLRNIELGRRNASPPLIEALAQALKVDQIAIIATPGEAVPAPEDDDHNGDPTPAGVAV